MAGTPARMIYVVDYDQTYLVVSGTNEWFGQQITILANPYCQLTPGGEMKRAHSIAQGAPFYYRRTGSYITGGSCDNMHLYKLNPDNSITSVLWTVDRNGESGSYPAKGEEGIIDWTEVNPFISENEIDIQL